MFNGKAMIILLIVGLVKKTLCKMIKYFPKARPLRGNMKV